MLPSPVILVMEKLIWFDPFLRRQEERWKTLGGLTTRKGCFKEEEVENQEMKFIWRQILPPSLFSHSSTLFQKINIIYKYVI